MTQQITINAPESAPSVHEGDDLSMSLDERGNLTIIERRIKSENAVSASYSYNTIAIYAAGFWADATVETLEDDDA